MSWRLPAGRTLVLALPFAWLGLFFLFPFLIVARIALSEAALGIRPTRRCCAGTSRARSRSC